MQANTKGLVGNTMTLRLPCAPMLLFPLLAFAACDGKGSSDGPVKGLAAQVTPVTTVQPTPTAIPRNTATVDVTVSPTAAPSVGPTEAPSPEPTAPPTMPPDFPKSELGLRLAPGIQAPSEGTGCDAVLLSTGTVAAGAACTQALLQAGLLPVGIFLQGAWVGTLGEQMDLGGVPARPSLNETPERGVNQFRASFSLPVKNVGLVQASDLKNQFPIPMFLVDSHGQRKASLVYVGAGSPRRSADGLKCAGADAVRHCPVRESIVYADQGQGQIGDLVAFRTLDGNDKVLGFITGGLFDERLRKEHGIKAIPWIVESP